MTENEAQKGIEDGDYYMVTITDQNGWVITDDKMATSVPGIFAIGDVRQKDLRQITTAVGEGAIAGIEAYNYVTALGDK